MRFCEKMLAVHIYYTIKRSYMRNLVKIGLLDFAVPPVWNACNNQKINSVYDNYLEL